MASSPIEINQKFLDQVIPLRQAETHKDTYGRVLALCGSRNYTGAAYFAAQAAVRTGSGVVMLGTPESVYPILAGKLSEPVVFPVACHTTGRMTAAGVQDALLFAQKARAVLFGCGVGLDEEIENCIFLLLTHVKVPLILDADGITALTAHIDKLRSMQTPVIITPHRGEFSRLIGKAPAAITTEDAADFAKNTGVIVLLKSHRTIIASPDGRVFRNTSGNPGMAKGGSGDVLAGIILSLCGQGLDPLDAVCAGAYLHGKAGDLCANTIGEYGMTPSDILQKIPLILRRYNSKEW